MSNVQTDPAPVASVADKVFQTFVETVADDTDLAEVAARLKTVLVGGKSITEASLRQALFGDTDG